VAAEYVKEAEMSVAQQNPTEQITYEDLYRRWEEGNWKASEIDFSQDRAGWESLSEIQTKSAMWLYSMFLYGEDAVTDGLSPYIDAAPKEEQKYFLATQQVDEARHSVFFHRFFKEVIGAGDRISETLASTHPHLGWGYRGVFGRLERMFDELRQDDSLPNFARAITLYHMIIEASMAQPAQHFIEDFFAKAGTLPGFSAGMEKVSRDEQRHIGFGVKVLSELFAESEECKAAASEMLREILPFTLAVMVPPNWDERYTTEYGFELEDIYAFGMRSVEMKWKATGYPLYDHPPGIYPFDPEMPHRDRAQRQIKLLRAGVLGEPNGKPQVDPEVERILFDVIARSADTDAVDRPVTFQWKFKDAEPYYVRIDNGSTSAGKGLAGDADVTLSTTWADWVDVATRGHDARLAMLRGKIRPRGSLRQLARMPKIFPPRPASSREPTASLQ
jgi:ribonucleotide reductase beta subunit family protein with ferritin-like domain